MEERYLNAVTAFAADAGVTTLSIREPAVAGLVNFGVEPNIEGHGLAGLLPEGLAGYYDGAPVSLDVARQLVRAMLRDTGAWCRLETTDHFWIHVGYDQYLYISSSTPCEHAAAVTRQLGLFAEPIPASPYIPEPADPPAHPADDAFWTEVANLVTERGPLLLEEGFLQNLSRWHRLTIERLEYVRARLTARSRLLLWPDLSTDVTAALSVLRGDGSQVVWEDQAGVIASSYVENEPSAALRNELANARAIAVLSIYLDERHPLRTAVLPDPDGFVRARWTP